MLENELHSMLSDINSVYLQLAEDFKSAKQIFLKSGVESDEIDSIFGKFKEIKDKNKIKSLEDKNIDHWAKRDFSELKAFVDKLYVEKTKKEIRKDIKMSGAEKIAENDEWVVFHITSHQACVQYGSGTKWCITGKDSKHFDEYSNISNFYYIISKNRSEDDPFYKIAFQAFSDGTHKFWDALDNDYDELPKDLHIPKFKYEHPEERVKINGKLVTYSEFYQMKDLRVGGDLDLMGTPITSLPAGLEVGGYLSLRGTKVTSLPAGLKVGRSLNLTDTPIESLPAGLKVGGYLDLTDTKITSLPAGLKVGGDLYLTNTPIKSLPADLKVGRSLDLTGTKVTSLPAGLKVGRGILGFKGDKGESISESVGDSEIIQKELGSFGKISDKEANALVDYFTDRHAAGIFAEGVLSGFFKFATEVGFPATYKLIIQDIGTSKHDYDLVLRLFKKAHLLSSYKIAGGLVKDIVKRTSADDDFIKENPDKEIVVYELHPDFIRKFGSLVEKLKIQLESVQKTSPSSLKMKQFQSQIELIASGMDLKLQGLFINEECDNEGVWKSHGVKLNKSLPKSERLNQLSESERLRCLRSSSQIQTFSLKTQRFLQESKMILKGELEISNKSHLQLIPESDRELFISWLKSPIVENIEQIVSEPIDKTEASEVWLFRLKFDKCEYRGLGEIHIGHDKSKLSLIHVKHRSDVDYKEIRSTKQIESVKKTSPSSLKMKQFQSQIEHIVSDINSVYFQLAEDFKSAKQIFLKSGISSDEIDSIFNKFKEIKDKNKIKSLDDKNIDHWAKRDFSELKDFVDKLYIEKTKKEIRKDIKMSGAEKIAENDEWVVFHITSHQACVQYGSGTKWCITGKDSKHFDEYSKISNFYYIISKTRSEDDKFHKIAFQAFSDGTHKFWDALDNDYDELPSDLHIPKFKYEHPEEKLEINGELVTYSEFYQMKNFSVDNSLDLRDTLITSLPAGLKVGGSLYLSSTPITSLPAGLKVGGGLYLSGTKITSLPAGLKVGGNLDLRGTQITSLPAGLKVGGYLDLGDTQITSLPAGLEVGGSLNFGGTPITSLPSGLKVGGYLYLSGTKITSLPADLKVGGNLDLSGTPITSLPADLEVGSNLYLSNTKITSLPADLKVGGDLDLRDTKITSLPADLKVGGDLDLSGTKITSLPAGLKVGGNLYLSDTKITSLPADLKVGGEIFGFQRKKQEDLDTVLGLSPLPAPIASIDIKPLFEAAISDLYPKVPDPNFDYLFTNFGEKVPEEKFVDAEKKTPDSSRLPKPLKKRMAQITDLTDEQKDVIEKVLKLGESDAKFGRLVKKGWEKWSPLDWTDARRKVKPKSENVKELIDLSDKIKGESIKYRSQALVEMKLLDTLMRSILTVGTPSHEKEEGKDKIYKKMKHILDVIFSPYKIKLVFDKKYDATEILGIDHKIKIDGDEYVLHAHLIKKSKILLFSLWDKEEYNVLLIMCEGYYQEDQYLIGLGRSRLKSWMRDNYGSKHY